MSKKKKRKHWYFRHCNECPVCGLQDVARERRYTRRPKDPQKRYSFTMMGCELGGACHDWR